MGNGKIVLFQAYDAHLNSAEARNRCWQSHLTPDKVEKTLLNFSVVCHTKHGEQKEEKKTV